MTAAGVAGSTARIAGKVISWLLLIACLASLAGAVWWVGHGKDDPQADIAGYRPYIVATGSMAPGYDVNSFVLTHRTPFEEVREGDVVSFEAAAIGDQATLHRIIAIQHAKGTDEPVAFVVKGDNNPHPDGAPVTRENYLGTAVLHTNFSSFVMQQYHAPHGLVRVVIVPAIVVVLIWLGGSYMLSGQRTRLGKTTVVLTITACLLASVTGSYALYLHEKEDHVVSTQDSHATRFEKSAPTTAVTVQGTTVNGTIDIPRIDVHYPVIEYVAASSLNVAITHFAGPGLNQNGNVVLAGHRAWDNLYFTRIDKLEPGDVIWITDSNRKHVKYVVTGHHEVEPSDTSVLDQPKDGRRHLTLISCTYDMRDRYIVDAVAAPDLSTKATPVEPTGEVAEAGIWPDRSVPVAVGLGAASGLLFLGWLAIAVRRRTTSHRG